MALKSIEVQEPVATCVCRYMYAHGQLPVCADIHYGLLDLYTCVCRYTDEQLPVCADIHHGQLPDQKSKNS